MKWIFAGCRNIALRVLENLICNNFIPEIIIILPQSTNDEIEQFKLLSDKCNCELVISDNIYIDIKYLNEIDLILLCKFNIIKTDIINAPKLGIINIHLSLLPNYWGIHPVSWALINGEKRAGTSIHYVTEKIDGGDILKQSSLEIKLVDNIWTLTDKLINLAINDSLDIFYYVKSFKKLPPSKKQIGKGFYARRRRPEDGKIDFNKNAIDIFNLVRALKYPLPLAYIVDENGMNIEVEDCILPMDIGKVLVLKDLYYIIRCADSFVIIKTKEKLKDGQFLK